MSATAFPRNSTNSRTTAMVAVAVTGIATAYTLALLLGMPDPAWAYLPRAVVHLGELAAVLALAVSGATGNGWLGRVGTGVAGLGLVLLAVAEALTVSSPDLSSTLFAIGPILVGIGLLAAGIAVVRAGRFTGWRRYPALVLGVYIFVVMTPVIIASGGPPSPAGLVALLGWEILWMLVAVSVLVERAGVRRGTAPALG